MKPAHIPSSIHWSSLLLSTAAAPALSDDSHVVILNVTESDIAPPSPPVKSLLTITGLGFMPGRGVFLGSTPITSLCPLNTAHTV